MIINDTNNYYQLNKIMNNNDYIQFQQELIEYVLQKKTYLHKKYEYILEKLSLSDKSDLHKLILSKRLLSRLIRESDKILNDAQKCSTDYCSCCDNGTEKSNVKRHNVKWLH